MVDWSRFHGGAMGIPLLRDGWVCFLLGVSIL